MLGGPVGSELGIFGACLRVVWQGSVGGWSGEGQWEGGGFRLSAEGDTAWGQALRTPRGFHHPAGLLASEHCQRQRNRIH